MLADPQASYGDAFIGRMQQKHLLARTKFMVLEKHAARARQQRVKKLPLPERLPRHDGQPSNVGDAAIPQKQPWPAGVSEA